MAGSDSRQIMQEACLTIWESYDHPPVPSASAANSSRLGRIREPLERSIKLNRWQDLSARWGLRIPGRQHEHGQLHEPIIEILDGLPTRHFAVGVG